MCRVRVGRHSPLPNPLPVAQSCDGARGPEEVCARGWIADGWGRSVAGPRWQGRPRRARRGCSHPPLGGDGGDGGGVVPQPRRAGEGYPFSESCSENYGRADQAPMAVQRVQLRRTRGWRIPPNTIKVDRSTRWGNPYKVGQRVRHPLTGRLVEVENRDDAIRLFALYIKSIAGSKLASDARETLRGKHVACWCPEGLPCHGDVLIRIANGKA